MASWSCETGLAGHRSRNRTPLRTRPPRLRHGGPGHWAGVWLLKTAPEHLVHDSVKESEWLRLLHDSLPRAASFHMNILYSTHDRTDMLGKQASHFMFEAFLISSFLAL